MYLMNHANRFYLMKLLLLLICSVFMTLNSEAQRMRKAQFVKDSLKIVDPKLARPQVKFDNRQTFCEGQWLAINGFDAGVLLKEKMRLTLGYYKLQQDLNAYRQTIDSLDYGRLLKMTYGTINTEIIYTNKRYYSLGMPLEIGAGINELKYKNYTTDEITNTERGFVAMAHFGLSATFKPIRWVGLKGIVGYRKTLFNQVKNFSFDGIFTSLGLNVDFREIIKDIQMIRLRKKYNRGSQIENAVDIITD
jgi:hypothetical protein